MRSEQQHIDEFIRNKTEEFHPDQRGIEPSWQAMQSMLGKPPATKFRFTKTRKLIKYVGGVVVVTVITVTLIQLNSKKKSVVVRKTENTVNTVGSNPVPESKSNSTTAINNTVKTKNANTTTTKKTENKVAPAAKSNTPKSSVANATLKKSAPKKVLTTKPIKKSADERIIATTETKKPEKPDPLLLLEQFYTELRKTPEEFFIRADRDTVLKAKEGTRLTIPSNSFDKKTGTIKIILTEFYKEEDMISGKLSTTSNGEQLITGGMLNIRAEADGQPVDIAPKKTIRVEMPTSNYDQGMQLFTGSTQSPRQQVAYDKISDRNITSKSSGEKSSDLINWIPAGQKQDFDGFATRVFKVPDIAGEPYKVKYGKTKITATFLISKDLKMSNKEVKDKLNRYSLYYDRIKVRRLWFNPNFLRPNQEVPVIKGDSITMKFESALRLKLVSKEDSLHYRQALQRDSLNRENRRKYLTNYRFEVNSLGWINCDRFPTLSNPVEFTINLGENADAGNFITQIVFTNYKSMMRGTNAITKIHFSRIPNNEPVHLISVGVIDGKVVSCIKSLNVTNGEISDLNFEETNTDQFKKKVTELIQSISR